MRAPPQPGPVWGRLPQGASALSRSLDWALSLLDHMDLEALQGSGRSRTTSETMSRNCAVGEHDVDRLGFDGEFLNGALSKIDVRETRLFRIGAGFLEHGFAHVHPMTRPWGEPRSTTPSPAGLLGHPGSRVLRSLEPAQNSVKIRRPWSGSIRITSSAKPFSAASCARKRSAKRTNERPASGHRARSISS